MDDNYSLWEQRQRKIDREESRYPVCSYCGHPIYDEELYDIEGETYHKKCLDEQYLKQTEDYIA